MKRFILALIWICAAAVQPVFAQSEIGYVEDFTGVPENYVVTRGTDTVPLQLLMPVYAGDLIEALTDKGRVTLRLVDLSEPVIWSRADRRTAITSQATEGASWSSILTATMAAISPFDRQKRARVLTAIRGDDGDFGIPLLQSGQTLAAGQRSISLGWTKSSTVTEISILARNGKKLVNRAKGVGGLWMSPQINLKPGRYRIVVSGGGVQVTGEIEVIAAEALPQVPTDLRVGNVPDTLARVAKAAWLAGQGSGQYRLEALQFIADDRSRPATVLTDALIAGQPIQLAQ